MKTKSGILCFKINIQGIVEDGVYFGRLMELMLMFPPNYPGHPPIAKFLTPIIHERVDKETNVVDIDILTDQGWNPATCTTNILIDIQTLL